MTLGESYAIQKRIVELRLAEGEKLVGMKIGLTSRAMQQVIGIDVPDYGHLTDRMLLLEGQPCRMAELIQPQGGGRAAIFSEPGTKGTGMHRGRCLRAVEYVAPAIEIVDSRIRGWNVTLLDTVADNGSSGKLVIGSGVVPLTAVDMRLTGMTLEKNGQLVNSGTTAEVWGNPAASVAWLANELSQYDIALKAGSIVLSGAVTGAPAAQAGITSRCPSAAWAVSACGLFNKEKENMIDERTMDAEIAGPGAHPIWLTLACGWACRGVVPPAVCRAQS